MRTAQQLILISGVTAVAFSCNSPIQIPSPETFPHNWLDKKIDSKSIDRLRSNGLPADIPRDAWETFLAALQPGDEVWRWEYPTGSNMYPDKVPYGCAILRSGKVVRVLRLGDLVRVD